MKSHELIHSHFKLKSCGHGRSLTIGGSVGRSSDVSVGGCRRGRATAISLSVSFLSSAESLRALSQANRR
ncbi:unnamed protein product [Brassica oleracea]